MLNRADLHLSDAVVGACAKFRQGSIVRDIPIAYTGDVRYRITPLAREQITESNSIASLDLPIAIITTQTCDIQNPKRMAIRPFISIARVFDANSEFDKGTVGHITGGRVADLVPLTGPRFANEGGVWIADLRLEVAIERGILVGKDPEDAFEDEEGYFRFQRSIAALRGRNAVDDRVLNSILKPLRDWLGERTELSDLIEEIRIRALPNILTVSTIELYLLTVDDADPVEVQDAASEWRMTLQLPDGLRLLDVSSVPTSAFTRADEIGTERLDLDDLSETA